MHLGDGGWADIKGYENFSENGLENFADDLVVGENHVEKFDENFGNVVFAETGGVEFDDAGRRRGRSRASGGMSVHEGGHGLPCLSLDSLLCNPRKMAAKPVEIRYDDLSSFASKGRSWADLSE